MKCALLISGHAHAVFDFPAERDFCRTNFPNFPDRNDGCRCSSDHGWSDDAEAWLPRGIFRTWETSPPQMAVGSATQVVTTGKTVWLCVC